MTNPSKLQQEILPSLERYSHILPVQMPVWELVININNIISSITDEQGVYIDPTARIHDKAIIYNSYIGKNVEIWEGCTIRDSIILNGTTVGHCTEVARSIVLGNCFLPRFNYIGGSLVGENVQLGGAVMFATKRHDNKDVEIYWDEKKINSHRHKFGSIIGDNTIISFGAHLNPGAVIGYSSIVRPLTDVRGFVPSNSVIYTKSETVVSRKRDIHKTTKSTP